MPRKGYEQNPERVQRCHARWVDEVHFIEACSQNAAPGAMRCKAHQPDGSALDSTGRPIDADGRRFARVNAGELVGHAITRALVEKLDAEIMLGAPVKP